MWLQNCPPLIAKNTGTNQNRCKCKRKKKSLAFLVYICGCVGGTNAHHKAHEVQVFFFFFPVYFQRKIGERMKLTEGGKEREIKREREKK